MSDEQPIVELVLGTLKFRGVHREIFFDETSEVCVEGALSSGKTILCLAKELEKTQEFPGIWNFIARWTGDATKTLVRPAYEQICRIRGIPWKWDDDYNFYEFPNGSRTYAFGLQTQAKDPEKRFGKIRGLPVSRIFIDQAEELPPDFPGELRARLRPDLEATLAGKTFPTQLTFALNPVEDHWSSHDFPLDDSIPGRKHYTVSLYDNAHVLPAETVDRLLRSYPKGHAKHVTMVLGQRGMAVKGTPVFGSEDPNIQPVFVRAIHERAVRRDPIMPLLEAIIDGKSHPVVVWGHITPYGQFEAFGGVFGQNMYLEDFIPILRRYRAEWFPGQVGPVHTCCAPAGVNDDGDEIHNDSAVILRDAGFAPVWKANANAPDIRLAMLERMTGYMRRRTPKGEAFGVEINPERWIRVSGDRVVPWKFITDGLEAGIVWDEKPVSVANKEIRRVKADNWYEHGFTALLMLEYNFGGAQPSPEHMERHAARMRRRALIASQRDTDDFRWHQPRHRSRAGY